CMSCMLRVSPFRRTLQVEVTVKLLKKAMQESGASKFLIDGFPRNFDNLEGWLRVIGDSAVVKGVLSFDCPEDEMEKRLLERGKTSGRSDDNIESIRKRCVCRCSAVSARAACPVCSVSIPLVLVLCVHRPCGVQLQDARGVHAARSTVLRKAG
ncbi:MAG: hypothetical protein EOO65_05390, partial [Methanosarcinales archaeon]